MSLCIAQEGTPMLAVFHLRRNCLTVLRLWAGIRPQSVFHSMDWLCLRSTTDLQGNMKEHFVSQHYWLKSNCAALISISSGGELCRPQILILTLHASVNWVSRSSSPSFSLHLITKEYLEFDLLFRNRTSRVQHQFKIKFFFLIKPSQEHQQLARDLFHWQRSVFSS